MERASRIVSILLGIGITALLWPVAVPLGFGEVNMPSNPTPPHPSLLHRHKTKPRLSKPPR
jgi:hypothetical protein